MAVDLPLPLTPACPATFARQSAAGAQETAIRLAEELEGARRRITLGGSLLLIPATMGVVVGAAGAVGLTGWLLVLCAFIGLAAGPGVCCGALALSTGVGGPLTRRVFRTRARALGLSDDEACAAWRAACRLLDNEDRERLLSGRRAES